MLLLSWCGGAFFFARGAARPSAPPLPPPVAPRSLPTVSRRVLLPRFCPTPCPTPPCAVRPLVAARLRRGAPSPPGSARPASPGLGGVSPAMENLSRNRYPFLSRADVKRRIESDEAYALECAVELERRTREREAGHGLGTSASGWMSSHRVVAARLVARLEAGKQTLQERRTLVRMVVRYARQLARMERERALRAHPELEAVACLFGVASKTEANGVALGQIGDQSGAEPDLASRTMQVVEGHPGCHVSEIAGVLALPTAEVSPVLRALVAEKRLRRHGEGRWATYSVRKKDPTTG